MTALAAARKVEVADIKRKLQSSGSPALTRATSATASAAVARLTDTSKYTGTHKLRFDAEGKGRGLEGRVDKPKPSGYVTGYKDADSFDAKHH